MIADIELSSRLCRALERGIAGARASQRSTLVSVVERIDHVIPLDVFHRCGRLERFYWRPTDGPTLTGCGSAHALQYHSSRLAEQEWLDLLQDAVIEGADRHATGPLLVGSLAFDPYRQRTALWDGFPLERLVLPRFLLTSDSETALTVNTIVHPESDAERLASQAADELRALLSGPAPLESPPYVTGLGTDSGDRFRAIVARAVDEIRLGRADKIVVARALSIEGSWTAAGVLERLQESQPHCTTFAVGQGETCFLGATPEWLVRLRDGEARVSCLAGTVGRGRDEEEDRWLGDSLLNSAKDQQEHALVLEMIVEALRGLALEVHVPEAPVLLKLPTLQHLSTPLTVITAGRTILPLVKRLHPTPAVAGVPREIAMQFLRTYEDLDRGAYAGPVGWLDRNGEGEFAVGIRSALLRGGEATAFAGCGIVADSDPESEYRESRLKLAPMLSALGAAIAP